MATKAQSESHGRIAYQFSLMSSLQTRALADMYTRKFGLSVNCWWVMAVIGRLPGGSASNVVGHTTLEADKVTRAVDVLVARGLVRRRQDDEDRRRVVLSLSAKGQKVFEEIEGVRQGLEGALLSVLGARERDAFCAALDKLEQRSKDIFSERHGWKQILEEEAL